MMLKVFVTCVAWELDMSPSMQQAAKCSTCIIAVILLELRTGW